MINRSIFEEFFEKKEFIDRYENEPSNSVDVIVPLINTNPLWRSNLLSIYREIPVRRLLIGDGGCTDDSIKVAREFPRVEVLDQREYASLGYCIKKLIEDVKTDYFVYLHADVFLPPGWFDSMHSHRNEYDWFECNRRMAILYEYEEKGQNRAERAYSGSQFGRTAAFKNILNRVDDDYLQRNEDIILMELVQESGAKYFRNPDTFHYHQVMNKKGEHEPNVNSVHIKKEKDSKWEARMLDMQVRGIIKYLAPKGYLVGAVNAPLRALDRIETLDWKEFCEWVKKTNPVWMRYIKNPNTIMKRTMDLIARAGKRLLERYM